MQDAELARAIGQLIMIIVLAAILIFPLKLLHNWFTRMNEVIKLLKSIDAKIK